MPALASDYRLCDKYRGKRRTHVTAYDVLACLTKSEPGTFEEFCSEYGYSSDSMRAHETWKAVRTEWRKVQGFFFSDEIAAIQEVQ